MILFAGIPSEPPIALAIESAERQGIPFLVLNQRHWPYCDFRLEVRDGKLCSDLWIGEKSWRLEDFTGIYSRTVEPEALPENQARGRNLPDQRKLARAAFQSELFNDMLEVAPCRVVNRPSAMASNVSKPFQAQMILSCGFKTPATLITNDPERVRAFQAEHGRVIYKSISSVRSIVCELPAGGGDLEKVRVLPTQFQAYVDGTNIRVHTIGDAVFATEITSGAVDYRYAGRSGEQTSLAEVSLPLEIEDRCRSLAKLLGLSFAGIDLKRTSGGEWYCFEVNTSPGYSYFQQQSGQPISDALAAYLGGREDMQPREENEAVHASH